MNISGRNSIYSNNIPQQGGNKKHLKNGYLRMGILLKTHFKDWKSNIPPDWLVENKKVDKFKLHILEGVFCYLSKDFSYDFSYFSYNVILPKLFLSQFFCIKIGWS